MNAVKVTGRVDERHRLSAHVPDSIPPGPVTVLIVPTPEEDDAGEAWEVGVAQEWSDDLSDPRQNIYSLTDGEPVHEA